MMMENAVNKHRKLIIKQVSVILIRKQPIVVQHLVIAVPARKFAIAKDASIIRNDLINNRKLIFNICLIEDST
jgi:hypothetical protein